MYSQIKTFIEQQQFAQAKELVHALKQTSEYTDTLAILEAEIAFNLNDLPGMFSCIQKGLACNYKNFELYYMLGNYYMNANPYQAFLCLEQAEFYCTDGEDLSVIQQVKQSLIDAGYKVPRLSIVILSYNSKDEMALCLDSIKETTLESSREIVIVDNASTDGVADYLKNQAGIKLFCSKKNLGFPAGCNLGIKMSEPDNDIFLLNNDTIVTANAIFWLRMGLYENPSVGATGSVSNHVPSIQQIKEIFSSLEEYMDFAKKNNIPMEAPYEKKIRLIGFALMLKRTALDLVGLLDERFSPGNFEDDDISLRMLLAGYSLLLCKNSFIYHFGSLSFGKDRSKYIDLCNKNMGKFVLKWGYDLHYYDDEKQNLVTLMQDTIPNGAFCVLEVGCGMGAALNYIKQLYPSACVYGVEGNEAILTAAKNYIPTITYGNIETMDLPYPEAFFDYILCADTLEQIRNPQKALKKLYKYLKPDGMLLVRIANLMHYSVILDLLKGNFTYKHAGIFDKTHLHFYTYREMTELFQSCGFQVNNGFYCIPNDTELTPDEQAIYDALMKIPGIAEEKEFQTKQYLFSAIKT